MTQEQLAELLNISTRSLQDYEAGVTVPWRHLQTLETIFRRPLGWFLHGAGDRREVGAPDELVAAVRELTAGVAALRADQERFRSETAERLARLEHAVGAPRERAAKSA